MPTPEPNAAYLLKSVTLRGPGIVIPAQHIDPGAVVRPPETDCRCHNAPQVRELAIGQANPCGGAESKDRLTAHAHSRVRFAAARSKTLDFARILERLSAPPVHNRSRGVRRNSSRHQNGGLGGVDIDAVHTAKNGDTIPQPRARNQAPLGIVIVASLIEIRRYPSH